MNAITITKLPARGHREKKDKRTCVTNRNTRNGPTSVSCETPLESFALKAKRHWRGQCNEGIRPDSWRLLQALP
jgi:hypothetical protein